MLGGEAPMAFTAMTRNEYTVKGCSLSMLYSVRFVSVAIPAESQSPFSPILKKKWKRKEESVSVFAGWLSKFSH